MLHMAYQSVRSPLDYVVTPLLVGGNLPSQLVSVGPGSPYNGLHAWDYSSLAHISTWALTFGTPGSPNDLKSGRHIRLGPAWRPEDPCHTIQRDVYASCGSHGGKFLCRLLAHSLIYPLLGYMSGGVTRARHGVEVYPCPNAAVQL